AGRRPGRARRLPRACASLRAASRCGWRARARDRVRSGERGLGHPGGPWAPGDRAAARSRRHRALPGRPAPRRTSHLGCAAIVTLYAGARTAVLAFHLADRLGGGVRSAPNADRGARMWRSRRRSPMTKPSPSPAPRRARALSLLATLLLIAACGDDGQQAAQPAPPTPTVTVATAEMRPVTPGRSFVGRIEAVEEVQIRARVQGFLETREFEEGRPVKAGQVLYRIERAPFEAEVAQREADLAAARAEAENANVQLKRALELVAEQNIPQATVDERRAAAATAEARVKQAEA